VQEIEQSVPPISALPSCLASGAQAHILLNGMQVGMSSEMLTLLWSLPGMSRHASQQHVLPIWCLTGTHGCVDCFAGFFIQSTWQGGINYRDTFQRAPLSPRGRTSAHVSIDCCICKCEHSRYRGCQDNHLLSYRPSPSISLVKQVPDRASMY